MNAGTAVRIPGKPVRVLFGERISFDRKERSDSIERQDARLLAHAEEESRAGWDIHVVGAAVDRSVSGDVNMHDREALGGWLNEEGLSLWDELWLTNQDRLSRDDRHVMAFVNNCLNWGKTIVLLDDPRFSENMLTPEGRTIIQAQAIGPAKELARIKQRVKESFDARRWTVAWTNGFPPTGYTTEKRLIERPDGRGLVERSVLVIEPHMHEVLHDIRVALINDRTETLEGLAERLNELGELTAKDAWRKKKGRPIGRVRYNEDGVEVREPEQWRGFNLKLILVSPHLLGIKMHKGKPMHTDDGRDFVIAQPIFTRDEWQSLQSAIKERGRKVTRKRTRRTTPSQLLGVSYCANCKKSATRTLTYTRQGEPNYAYYRCMNPLTRCPGVSMRAEVAEPAVAEAFLKLKGKDPVPLKEWQPGEDHTEALEDIEKRIARLLRQDERGYWDGNEDEFEERMDMLVERRKELRGLPQRAAGWVYIPRRQHEGECKTKNDKTPCDCPFLTYEHEWLNSDDEGRRHLYIDAGIKLLVGKKSGAHGFNYEVHVPDTPKYEAEYFGEPEKYDDATDEQFEEWVTSLPPMTDKELAATRKRLELV